jgi:hypothetical protein
MCLQTGTENKRLKCLKKAYKSKKSQTLSEASLQFVVGCEAQKTTAEILCPDKSGLRMTGDFNLRIRVQLFPASAPFVFPLQGNCYAHTLSIPALLLLTPGWENGSLSWLTYGERRHRAREGDSKAARRGAKRLENAKKILDRGNKAKDLLKTQHLALFGAQNKPNFECNKKRIKAKKQAVGARFQVIGAGG